MSNIKEQQDKIIYVRVDLQKFNWPQKLALIVVFFKNRERPFIGYNDGEYWFNEEGLQTKTPICYLKQTNISELLKQQEA